MTLITNKPVGLASGNDLDSIPDDLLGGPPPPAEIRLAGKTLTVLENPPAGGEDVVLLVRLKVRAAGVDFNDDGNEEVPYRSMKLVSCWKPGDKEPEPVKTKAELDAEAEAEAAKNQPPLYGDDGEPYDPQTDPEVDRPGFSDAGGA